MRYSTLVLFLALTAVVALPILAQPAFRGGDVHTVPASGDLAAQIAAIGRSDGESWVGYSIPLASGRHISICCGSYDGNCGNCSLDDESSNITTHEVDRKATMSAAILYRLRAGTVDTVRVFGADCTIGAEGSRIHWIQGVDVRASAAYLAMLARSESSRAGKKSTFALWLHPDGTDMLIDLARHGGTSKIRSSSLFWLSQSAGEKAAAALRDAVENDPDDDVKGKAVFGISQLPDDRSIPMLLDLMRTNRNRNVRKKAAFWLGQKHDPRALDAIERFLRN
jgi:hypothetical protein